VEEYRYNARGIRKSQRESSNSRFISTQKTKAHTKKQNKRKQLQEKTGRESVSGRHPPLTNHHYVLYSKNVLCSLKKKKSIYSDVYYQGPKLEGKQ